MADEPPVDQLRQEIKTAVDAAAEEVGEKDKLIVPILLAEDPQGAKAYAREMTDLQEQQRDLEKAAKIAHDLSRDPQFVSAEDQYFVLKTGKYTTFDAQRGDLDNAITNWLNSLKSRQQDNLEKFLFGAKEQIEIRDYYHNSFKAGNWGLISQYYYREAEWRGYSYDQILTKFVPMMLKSGASYILPSQINQLRLKELEDQRKPFVKEYDKQKTRLDKYDKLHEKYKNSLISKGETAQEADCEAHKLATNQLLDEEKPGEEPKPTGGVSQKVAPTPQKEKAQTPAISGKKELTPAQLQARRMMAEQAEMMKYWNLWRRDPKSILGSLGGAWMEYWGNLSGYRPEAIPTEPQPAILPAEDLPKPGQIAGPEPVFVAETSPTGAQPEPGQVQTPEEPAKQLNWLQKLTSRFISKKDLRLAGEVGGKLVGVAAKEGKNVVIAQAGKRSFSLLLKNFVKGVAAKLGISAVLGVIPTGVTQVAAAVATLKAVTDVIIPESIRNQLQDLWSKAQIAMGAGITWLLMNPGALIGGILGGAVGGFFFGPVGMAGGFIAGATLGVSLQGILGPMLGFGGTALPVGSAIAAPAGITGVTGGAGVSGFGAVSSGMVTGAATGGVFGLSTAGITTFISGGIAPVMTAVITVAVGTAFTIITAVSAFVTVAATAPQQQIATGDFFTLEKTVDKANLPSDSKATVTYKITLKADSDISVTLNDKLTRGSTSLLTKSETINLAKGEKKEFAYTYTVTAADNDSELVNTATATAKAGTETETLNAVVKTKITSGAVAGGSCPVAPAGTVCDPERFRSSFGAQAENASRICVRESGEARTNWQNQKRTPDFWGDENAVYDSCTNTKLSPAEMREYSVGLFQVNLWAHDNLCKQVLGGKTPFNKPFFYDRAAQKSCSYPDCTPCDRDEELLQQCKDYWIKPENNMKYASELLKSKNDRWSDDWGSAKPEYCNLP